MLVAETDDGYRFVTQRDHATLAGRFADRWGNGAFDRPEPFASVAAAAHHHDDGWWTYDKRPHLHGDGAPVDFTELQPATWIGLYEDGIDSAVELDPYAGLLVSMHGAGLRRRRYGLSPSWSDTPEAYADFVEREEARQCRLAGDLRSEGRLSEADVALLSTLHETGSPPEGADSDLWRNYRLLQAWDVLSLAFCTTVEPPGYDGIGPAPTTLGEPDATLDVEPLGDDRFRVEPYPFDVEPLPVSVPTRTVRRDSFDDEASLREAYYAAGREVVRFELRGSGRTNSGP